jgi:hypothetical protein
MARRAFLAAPFHVDAGPLVQALARHDWDVYVLSDVADLGASLRDALEAAIRAADVVIAVFPSATASANTAFEAGLAVGLGKPLLSIVEPGAEGPADLSSSLSVRARLDNVDAVVLALENIHRSWPPRTTKLPTSSAGRPLGAYADTLLAAADGLRGTRGPAHAIEELVVRAIEASGAVAVPSTRDEGFDIGVWADDLDAIAGNPLLIEIKRRFSKQAVEQCLVALGQVPGARAALLISLEGSPSPQSMSLRWPVFWISLDELLRQMRTASFAEVFRLLRNRSVHGGEPA